MKNNRCDLGNGMAVIVVAGGYRLEHWCNRHLRFPDSPSYLVAPSLRDHTCTGPVESVTVTPSILCSDCGIHGFVTEGVWRGC